MYRLEPLKRHMRITILAVTEAFGGLCIAGIDDKGKWVRPLGSIESRFWPVSDAGISGRPVETGDIWEIEGSYVIGSIYPNHTEDFTLHEEPKYIGKWDQPDLLQFLQSHVESYDTLDQIMTGQVARSLCLRYVPGIEVNRNRYGNIRANMPSQKNPITSDDLYALKCLKSRGLFVQQKLKNQPSYVCIGLSTKDENYPIEYPMVIGIHNDQTADIPADYPKN